MAKAERYDPIPSSDIVSAHFVSQTLRDRRQGAALVLIHCAPHAKKRPLDRILNDLASTFEGRRITEKIRSNAQRL